jgi:hypothetical protein
LGFKKMTVSIVKEKNMILLKGSLTSLMVCFCLSSWSKNLNVCGSGFLENKINLFP